MDMTGERRIPAPRQKVWEALNDPVVLKACIPGCESLEKEGDAMRATAAVKIGPIAARFTGKVQLSDLNPPSSYRISGEGQGGVAGFAKGGANVQLADDGDGTLLTYDVKAQVGGKIAQLGARLIDATSKQMADMFFDRFTNMVAGQVAITTADEDQVPGDTEADSPSITPVAQRTVAPKAGAPGTMAPQPGPSPSPALVPTPPPAAPAISIFSLIPSEMFGLPLVAIIGIVLYIPIFILIFKSYVF